MADRIRVQKAMANAGLMSRRAAEEAIAAGRVTIDGRVAVLGDRVDVESEVVALDGTPLPVNPELETHLVYKPVGVISTADDPQGRQTVVDLVSSEARLYPVGRLDADSEGLILLTNDGELTNRVTHPRYGITKTYIVLVEGSANKAQMRRLVEGVSLDDGEARARKARILETASDSTMIEIVMGEGRNREIRRMMEQLDLAVTRLIRVKIGNLSDQSLRPGQSRPLSSDEVVGLMKMAVDD